MLKIFTLSIAAGALFALATIDANALPVTPAKQLTIGSNVTLVRDRCGRDRHFGDRRGRCVDDFDSRPRHREFRDDCGRHQHFSRRMGRCVWDDRGERDDHRDRHNDDDAAAAAVFGAVLNGIAHSNNRNHRSGNNQNHQQGNNRNHQQGNNQNHQKGNNQNHQKGNNANAQQTNNQQNGNRRNSRRNGQNN